MCSLKTIFTELSTLKVIEESSCTISLMLKLELTMGVTISVSHVVSSKDFLHPENAKQVENNTKSNALEFIQK